MSFAQRHITDTYEFRDNLRVNTKTNVAEVMYSTDKRVYEGSKEEIALQFLQEHKNVFGITKISDLKLLEKIESPGGNHVGFIQTYMGIPVYGSETVVSINDKNQIETVKNGCIPIDDKTNTTANITRDNAISNAKLKIKVNAETLVTVPKAELYIYPDSLYQMHLVWKINFVANDPIGDWQIFVDASNGEILKIMDISIRNINGSGKVFKPDPITALQNTSLTDQNNSDYSELQSAYDILTLNNLNKSVGGVYKLQGKYARSEDIELPNISIVTSSTSSFLYNRSQVGFEETNVYYFLDIFRQYVGGLGFAPKWNGYDYIRFDAHGFNGADNSHYVSSSQYLAYGDGGIDDAEDQDVVLHEYGHALHDALMVGTGISGTDEARISEGTGDYLAVSYRRTLSSFQPNKVFPWDGNGETWNGRSLSSTHTYPSQWTGLHDPAGVLWASTMMDIQNYGDIGRDVANKLLLKSFNYASGSSIASDHVFYVMKADQSLYGESHLSSLGKGFYNRGFFNANPGVHPSNLLSGDITTSTDWYGIKYVNGNTYIKPGVTVRSYAFLFIGEKKKIVVENGATLGIHGSLVEYLLADIVVEPGGTLYFAKRAIDQEITDSQMPSEYQLLGNYPNPFNPATTIKYSLPKESSVDLRIFDLLGREVKSFNINSQPAGFNEITWDGRNEYGESVSSGIYIYSIKFRATGSSRIIEKSAKLVLTK